MSSIAVRRVTLSISLLGGLCSVAPAARAHGGPPSVVGIVAADASGPTVVLVNEGLGLKRDGRWTFLCPSLWGNTSSTVAKVPLALAADDQTSWIAGQQDLYRLQDGVFEPQGRSDLNSSHVELLAGDSRGVFALVLTDAGTEIVRFGVPQPQIIWHSTDYWSSFVLNGDLLQVARVTDDAKSLVLVSLSMTGDVTEMRTIARDFAGDASVDLRPTPHGLFAVMSSGMERLLVAVEEQSLRVVVRSATPILGPQASPDGSLWIGADDQLRHAAGDTYEATPEPRVVTCMGRWNSRPYACVTGELYAIENTGLGTALFRLQGFEGPEPRLVPDATKQYCDFQWLLFKNDLTLGNYGPVDAVGVIAGAGAPGAGVGPMQMQVAGAEPTQIAGSVAPQPAPAAHGCSVRAAGGDTPMRAWLIVAGLVLMRQRRRRSRLAVDSGITRSSSTERKRFTRTSEHAVPVD